MSAENELFETGFVKFFETNCTRLKQKNCLLRFLSRIRITVASKDLRELCLQVKFVFSFCEFFELGHILMNI